LATTGAQTIAGDKSFIGTSTLFTSQIFMADTAASKAIRFQANTVDGTDDYRLLISSGGGAGPNRGAYVEMHANEFAATPGRVLWESGSAASGTAIAWQVNVGASSIVGHQIDGNAVSFIGPAAGAVVHEMRGALQFSVGSSTGVPTYGMRRNGSNDLQFYVNSTLAAFSNSSTEFSFGLSGSSGTKLSVNKSGTMPTVANNRVASFYTDVDETVMTLVNGNATFSAGVCLNMYTKRAANSAYSFLTCTAGDGTNYNIVNIFTVNGEGLCRLGANNATSKGLILEGNDAGYTASALKYYQDGGGFNPSINFSGGNGNRTYSSVGYFTRIGNLCHFQAFISAIVVGTASGSASINLPFASVNASNLYGTCVIGLTNGVSVLSQGNINPNDTNCSLLKADGMSGVATTDFGGSAYFHITISYLIA
jgi:hypothetical protein